MDSNFIVICIFVAMFFVGIIYIENKEKINAFLNKHISVVFYTMIIITVFLFFGAGNYYIKNRVDKYIVDDAPYNNVNKELTLYRKLKKENYNIDMSSNPYIPDGFHYVEGEALSGYVIEDDQGNQYVWVPCTNVPSKNIPELSKKDFSDMDLTLNMDCYDSEYEEFFKSAYKNGGFYVSRYELGKINDNIVSKSGAKVITDVSRKDAEEIAKGLYQNNNNIKCQLMTGYAYDTMLSWIEQTNEVEGNSIDCSKETEIISGRNEYNRINDLYDSILEMTCENYTDLPIARGFSHLKTIRPVSENPSRYTLNSYDDTEIIATDEIAIRTMIYKVGE